jgi:hypothetical protein
MEQVFSCGSMASNVLGAFNTTRASPKPLAPQHWQDQSVVLGQQQLQQPFPGVDFAQQDMGFNGQGVEGTGIGLGQSPCAHGGLGLAPAGLQDPQVLNLSYSSAACSQPFLLAYPDGSLQPAQAMATGYGSPSGVFMPLAQAESLEGALGQLGSCFEVSPQSTPSQLSGELGLTMGGPVNVGAFSQGHPCGGEFSLSLGYSGTIGKPGPNGSVGFGWA